MTDTDITYGLAELDEETHMGGAGTNLRREIRRIDLTDFEARRTGDHRELVGRRHRHRLLPARQPRHRTPRSWTGRSPTRAVLRAARGRSRRGTD
ncbi:hypothetical protein [Streptomyces sp. KL116D]|uniref:hypothetical protein n=1 Tax=Streptomyces sp. KL116D TaxID=3045152 RepID=UPI003557AB8A